MRGRTLDAHARARARRSARSGSRTTPLASPARGNRRRSRGSSRTSWSAGVQCWDGRGGGHTSLKHCAFVVRAKAAAEEPPEASVLPVGVPGMARAFRTLPSRRWRLRSCARRLFSARRASLTPSLGARRCKPERTHAAGRHGRRSVSQASVTTETYCEVRGARLRRARGLARACSPCPRGQVLRISKAEIDHTMFTRAMIQDVRVALPLTRPCGAWLYSTLPWLQTLVRAVQVALRASIYPRDSEIIASVAARGRAQL